MNAALISASPSGNLIAAKCMMQGDFDSLAGLGSRGFSECQFRFGVGLAPSTVVSGFFGTKPVQ